MIPLSAPAGDNSLTKRALAHGSFRYNKSVRPEGATRLLAVFTAAEAHDIYSLSRTGVHRAREKAAWGSRITSYAENQKLDHRTGRKVSVILSHLETSRPSIIKTEDVWDSLSGPYLSDEFLLSLFFSLKGYVHRSDLQKIELLLANSNKGGRLQVETFGLAQAGACRKFLQIHTIDCHLDWSVW